MGIYATKLSRNVYNFVYAGEFHTLVKEMMLFDAKTFFESFRMLPSRFEHLLSLVGPRVQKKKCHSRNTISPSERLIVTLR